MDAPSSVRADGVLPVSLPLPCPQAGQERFRTITSGAFCSWLPAVLRLEHTFAWEGCQVTSCYSMAACRNDLTLCSCSDCEPAQPVSPTSCAGARQCRCTATTSSNVTAVASSDTGCRSVLPRRHGHPAGVRRDRRGQLQQHPQLDEEHRAARQRQCGQGGRSVCSQAVRSCCGQAVVWVCACTAAAAQCTLGAWYTWGARCSAVASPRL